MGRHIPSIDVEGNAKRANASYRVGDHKDSARVHWRERTEGAVLGCCCLARRPTSFLRGKALRKGQDTGEPASLGRRRFDGRNFCLAIPSCRMEPLSGCAMRLSTTQGSTDKVKTRPEISFESSGWGVMRSFLDPSELGPIAASLNNALVLPRPPCMSRPGNDLIPLRWSDDIVARILG